MFFIRAVYSRAVRAVYSRITQGKQYFQTPNNLNRYLFAIEAKTIAVYSDTIA